MAKYVYDKLSDTLCRFHKSSLSVKFVLQLSSKDMGTGKSKSVYGEYAYNSGKYTDTSNIRGLSINLRYYVSISDGTGKLFVMVKPENMRVMKRELRRISEWYLHPKFNGLFKVSNELLVVDNSFKCESTIPLSNDKKLVVKPKVVDDNGVATIGAEFIIDDIPYEVTLNEILDFEYHMCSLNMHQLATTLFNTSLLLGKVNTNNEVYKLDNTYSSNNEYIPKPEPIKEDTSTVSVKRKISSGFMIDNSE